MLSHASARTHVCGRRRCPCGLGSSHECARETDRPSRARRHCCDHPWPAVRSQGASIAVRRVRVTLWRSARGHEICHLLLKFYIVVIDISHSANLLWQRCEDQAKGGRSSEYQQTSACWPRRGVGGRAARRMHGRRRHSRTVRRKRGELHDRCRSGFSRSRPSVVL